MEGENFDISEGGGGLSQSSEAPSEKSEKQKESSRRAQAQLQKIHKDEKRAKADNDELFQILSRFIQNPLYEALVPSVTLLLERTYPSRFIMAVVALVFPEASSFLFSSTKNEQFSSTITHLYRYPERQELDDKILHPSLRDWVTTWVHVSQEFLLDDENSLLMRQKLISLFSSEDISQKELGRFFVFFFDLRNLTLSQKKAKDYASFIILGFREILEKSLQNADTDIIASSHIDAQTLFGI